MENGVVSLQDVANIVTFIAPGYFAIQVYSWVYAKKEREFPRLLIESVVYSLPIITICNLIWQNILRQDQPGSISVAYSLTILVVSIIVGLVASLLRGAPFVVRLVGVFGVGSPYEDFIKAQLLRIRTKDPLKNTVTVKLKSGVVFSGTSDRISNYNHSGPTYYYFANLAWYDDATDEWDERNGGVIISSNEIEYIETPKLSDKV
jgi:hypothetical protein